MRIAVFRETAKGLAEYHDKSSHEHLTDLPHRTASPMRRRETDIPSVDAPTGRRLPDRWLERWTATVDDVARLTTSHSMSDAMMDGQRRRQVRAGECWPP
jgi:hypothetical protein